MRKFVLNSVVVIAIFALFVNGKSDHGSIPCLPIQVSPTNISKDNSLQNELNDLSDKLGVKLDETCDIHLMETLADWIGTPYRHAGYSKKGIDCSGFVSRIYKEVYGINLTHSARSMISQMKERVKKNDLKTGDIVFFHIHGKRISHVGIYIKDGVFIHASLEKGIGVDRLCAKYYTRSYFGAGRVLNN
jgi:lipoprotein Spr/probable lipoprotein NlpC